MKPRRQFDGRTFDPRQDGARLGAQLEAVRGLMLDGRWRTLYEISEAVGAPEQSVSARLRDLRKPKFGEHTVLRRRREGQPGTHEYKLILRRPAPAPIRGEQQSLFQGAA